MKRAIKYFGIVVACTVGILLVGPFVVPLFSPWSEINCEHQEIDIKTGRARFRRYIWFVQVSARTKDTLISELLDGREVSVADVRRWHRVNTFGPYVNHSPHYIYHGAFSQIQHLSILFELYDPSDTERQDAARRLLVAWQHAGDYFGADDSLTELEKELEARRGDDRSTTAPQEP